MNNLLREKEVMDKLTSLKEENVRLNQNIGFLRTIKNNINYLKKLKLRKYLIKLKKENEGKKVIIFPHVMRYYDIMKQRPQQIADEFAKKNDILYFYLTDDIEESFIRKISENLYLLSDSDTLTSVFDKYILHMYANCSTHYFDLLKVMEVLSNGNKIIYEYIDALDAGLLNVSEEILLRHNYLLNREDVPVFCTARVLYDEVINNYRKKNVHLTSNGVRYEDFNNDNKKNIPDDIKKIIKKGNKIITYYGAIAKWVDYELIEKIAKHNKNYHIVMIGKNYYHEVEELEKVSNIHFLGPVEYKKLINYGYYSDVLIIPFLINDITKATSPVKIFEYMAMEKPIVITKLPECKKYKSINIANNHDEFIQMVDKSVKKALTIKEKQIMKKEALENTWEQKTNEIYREI